MVCLHPSFSGVLWAIWVGTSLDGAPVFAYEWLPLCGGGATTPTMQPADSSQPPVFYVLQ